MISLKGLFNFSFSVFKSNFKIKVPYKLTYAITYKCNSKCKICSIWKKKDYEELTIKEVESFFKNNNYFKWIDLTGGEVFLKNNLLDVIKIIVKYEKNLVLLHIPTNGIATKMIADNVQEILKLYNGKFIISISMDGPPELHNKLRGIEGNWKTAVETYKELKKLKTKYFDCYFGMTLSKYNYKYIEETFLSLKKEISTFNRNDLHFNIAHTSEHYYANENFDVRAPGLDIYKEIKKYNSKKRRKFSIVSWLESRYQMLAKNYLSTGKTPLPCRAMTSSFFLDPLGNVYPCSMWNKPLGNIKDCDFKVLNMLNKKEDILNLIKQSKCPNCWTPCEAYQTILGNLI